MATFLLLLGAACSAAVVWLVVRALNRRERWARWSLAAIVGVPALYVLSLGPACYLFDREVIAYRHWKAAYHPIVFVAVRNPRVGQAIGAYADVFGGDIFRVAKLEQLLKDADQQAAASLPLSFKHPGSSEQKTSDSRYGGHGKERP